MNKNKVFGSLLVLLVVIGIAVATDMSYTTLLQTSDSAKVIENKVNTVMVNGDNFTNVIATGTALLKTGSGVLSRVIVNTAGTGSTIKVWDGLTASGTVGLIGTATTTAQGALIYNAHFATGLSYQTTGTAGDITLIYR